MLKICWLTSLLHHLRRQRVCCSDLLDRANWHAVTNPHVQSCRRGFDIVLIYRHMRHQLIATMTDSLREWHFEMDLCKWRVSSLTHSLLLPMPSVHPLHSDYQCLEGTSAKVKTFIYSLISLLEENNVLICSDLCRPKCNHSVWFM